MAVNTKERNMCESVECSQVEAVSLQKQQRNTEDNYHLTLK